MEVSNGLESPRVPHVFAPSPKDKVRKKPVNSKIAHALEDQYEDAETKAALEVKAWFGGDSIAQNTERYFDNPILVSDDEDEDDEDAHTVVSSRASHSRALSQKLSFFFKFRRDRSDSPASMKTSKSRRGFRLRGGSSRDGSKDEGRESSRDTADA